MGSTALRVEKQVERRLRARLVGVRFELDEAIREVAADVEDPLLRQHLDGSLLDAEGALQRLDQLVPHDAPCTAP